ncbi:MAG: hypothetical protein BSR46_10355 [Candidatus Dactylopiibacterium carminicum]|nr:TonB family protein [Candidatus Dactylopiibacterium carminicum]PAS99005.1 MAG: hypothetical protein BSR46_10355 [Candidatus Dactylopiibacterium carminicum]
MEGGQPGLQKTEHSSAGKTAQPPAEAILDHEEKTIAGNAGPLTLAQHCPQRTKPLFPSVALRDGIDTGRVLLRLHLAVDGSVHRVEVLEASPRGYFEAASEAATLKWRCLPPAQTGQDSVRAPIHFEVH